MKLGMRFLNIKCRLVHYEGGHFKRSVVKLTDGAQLSR